MSRLWYEDAMVYHVYSFSLANAPFHNDYNSHQHKLADIEKWIPHIKGMGFNAVLFSPVLKSRSHGYDVTDYFQLDNRLGDNDGFRWLVERFHENGIRVVLDSVFNHCGRDFFAFQELKNGNRGYADWFSGVDFNRQSPMGDWFTYDCWSGYYELVKFNLRNNDIKQHLFDAARFWIDHYGIDGMRLDSANVMDFDFMRQLRYVVTEKKHDFWLMGEVVHGDYNRWVNNEMLHSVTNYTMFKSLFSSHNDNNLYELAYNIQNSPLANGRPLYSFLDNHDQPRIASNVKNPAHIKTLYALLFTLPGVPSVYYGSEWGIHGVKEHNSDSPLRPYIDISSPPHDPHGIAGYLNGLISLRNNHPALRYGSYRQIFLEYRRPYVFERSYEGEKVIVAVNIGDNEDTVNIHCNARDLQTGEQFNGQVKLPPVSARVMIAV
jgi:glycosidase